MIARGGMALVMSPALVAVMLVSTALVLSSNIPILMTLPFGVIFLVFLWFFRDPERTIGDGVVSPADGRILEIDPASGRVTIYMSFLSVHVNRAPWPATILSRTRKSGGHAAASLPSATKNHSIDWGLGTSIGTMRLRQVAGLVARRIVPYVDEGARIKKGQKIGLIRFGSRVELELPPSVKIVVAVGDHVRAGETKIAEVVHGISKQNQTG